MIVSATNECVVWRETCYCMPFSWKVVYLCKHYPLWTSVTEFVQWCLVKIFVLYSNSAILLLLIVWGSIESVVTWTLERVILCVLWLPQRRVILCVLWSPWLSILCVLRSPRLRVWEWFCVFCGHPDLESESDSVCSVVTLTQRVILCVLRSPQLRVRVILCVLWSPRLRVWEWFCVVCGYRNSESESDSVCSAVTSTQREWYSVFM